MSDPHALLIPAFPKAHIDSALKHFSGAVDGFGRSDWEGCIVKSGKFVEAILKGVATHCSFAFETGRKFKADKVMNGLGQLNPSAFDDSLRLLIPRACRVIYDIASNRGARHDSEEIDANAMDANVVVPIASWILAELIRYSQKGAVDPSEAKALVEGLVERKYPVIENVDGHVYFHGDDKSATDVALVLLAERYPRRMIPHDLVAAIKRHRFSANNARLAVQRVKKFVDENEEGNLRLLQTGLRRAEEIVKAALGE